MPDITKEQLFIILGIITIVLIGCVVGIYSKNNAIIQSSPESSPQPILTEKPAKTEVYSSIYVHISGSVAKEGLYKLNRGDRLVDLLKLSGVASNADIDSVNLAEVLTDGQRVFMPKKALNLAQAGQTTPPTVRSGKAVKMININRADEKELDALPGIGPTMAKRIVDHRNEKGKFSSIEELKEVQGISEKKYEKLKGYITVN